MSSRNLPALALVLVAACSSTTNNYTLPVGATGPGAGGAASSSSSSTSSTSSSASSTTSSAASSGAGGAGGASSSSGGGAGGSGGASASSSTSSSSSSSSTSSSSSGVVPVVDCTNQPTGTPCTNGGTGHLCEGNACVGFIPVNCKVGVDTYTGCAGVAPPQGQIISIAGKVCQGASDYGYCAPGHVCYVFGVGPNMLSGTCQ